MANQTFIVPDDYATLDEALQNILTGSDYVDGTTTTTIRVKGPNSGGPSQYQGDYSDLTSASGGWLVAVQIEAFDPNDKPVFDGSVNPRTPFIRADGPYESGLPTSYKSSFSNIIFQNYTGLSTSIGSGFFYGSSGGSVDFTGCEFTNMTGGECLQRYSSDSNRQAIVDSCVFNDCQYGIIRGSGNNILVKNSVFSNYQIGSEPSDAFFAKIHVTGGNTKVFNNSVAVALSSPGTQDIITACSASNNAMIVNPGGGNIDGIYVEKYGGNVVFFASTTSGREINTLGDAQDLGSNITGENPDFTNPGSNDLTISATSPAAQNGIELLDVTDDIAGTPRGRLSYLRDGFLQSEVVYDAGAYQITTAISDRLRSGMISPTARLMLQTRDVATGSYPTIARTGDSDFTGRYDSKYDDTNTIVFESNNPEVIYPMMLPSGTKFVKNDLLYPDYFDWDDRAIISNGNIRAGISDAHVSFTPGENISPFDESRIYLDNDSQFYMTGTASGTLPGFSQRLGSKTSISFELNNTQDHEVYFSTGSSAVSRHSGMSYFNFNLSRWETHGNLSSATEVDILDGDFQKGYLGFSMSSAVNYVSADEDDPRGIGYPVSNFGFPYDVRYAPTGSQLLSLSSSLTAPFLLEKIVLSFSGAFPASLANTDNSPLTSQFFILRQGIQGSVSELKYQDQAVGRAAGTTTFEKTPITQSLDCDLVSYGIISRFSTNTNTSTVDRGRDLNLAQTSATLTAVTGTYRLEFPCRTISLNPGNALLYDRTAGSTAQPNYLLDNSVGTRSGFLSSGRSFIKNVGGFIPSSSILQLSSSNPDYGYHVPKVQSYDSISPYVLNPNDSICLGFSNIPFAPYIPFGSSVDESGLANTRLGLPAASIKLTLFGSLLQGNLPKEPETNQPLTSDAVHEDLHYDNPVYDQWDVEPYSALSGSYVDLVITGSMIPDGERGVVASVVAGHAGTTGSLQRFVRLTDSVGKLYDSYPPNVGDVLQFFDKGGFSYPGAPNNKTLYGVMPSVPSSAWGINTPAEDREWWLRTAYEIISTRVVDNILVKPGLQLYDPSTGNPTVVAQDPINQIRIDASVGVAGSNFYVSSISEAKKSMWGFGDNIYNAPTFIENGIFDGEAVIRGYKYGLGGLLGSSLDVRYRRDRYGQFRDMLEGRKYPATLVGNSVEYPIDIAFVQRDSTSGGTVDPSQTHSQNLDLHASSSLPYYDGLAVERPDDPDETLVPVEVS